MKGKLEDFNFRELNHSFILLIDLDYSTLNILRIQFGGNEEDNAVLTYGYIDADAGISFEVLSMAKYTEEGDITLGARNPSISFKLRYNSIKGNVININYWQGLDEIFDEKVRMINDGYRVNEVVEESRRIMFVDIYRHWEFPDDWLIFFVGQGYRTERMWVRISTIKNGKIAGKLLNEPHQNWGVHIGDIIPIEPVRCEGETYPTASLVYV